MKDQPDFFFSKEDVEDIMFKYFWRGLVVGFIISCTLMILNLFV